MTHVLIVGGYGAFGSLVTERLSREPGLTLSVAGRNLQRARSLVTALQSTAKAELRAATLDAHMTTPSGLAALVPDIVINASGPFQAQDYTLARACIVAGCHYIDLADARAFVVGIATLDDAAKAAGVAVISGASSVPGLSSAAYDTLKSRFVSVDALEIYLSPGNHFNPGEATTRSVLGGVGRPVATLVDGKGSTVYGWQGLRRRTIAGIGRRWFGYVDVPDLELFPAAHANLRTVRFQAGLEVPLFHLSLWALSGLKRGGLISDVASLTKPLMRIKQALGFLGSDRGGMLMTLIGTDHDGRTLALDWSLAANGGHGPYIPAMASIILTKRLAQGRSPPRPGAYPCFGLFSLTEFLDEVSDLRVTASAVAQVLP